MIDYGRGEGVEAGDMKTGIKVMRLCGGDRLEQK
jgi:hypothetical protein